MTTTESKPTIVSTTGQLFRHDAVFAPAMFIAVLGTLSAVVAPPAWIGRVPAAVGDVATGGRETLRGELVKASEDGVRLRGERDALSTRLSSAEGEHKDTRARLAQTETALVEARSSLSDTAQIASTSQTAMAEQRRRIAALDQELTGIRSELAQQTGRRQLLTAKLEQQDTRVAELRAERNRLRQSITAGAEKIAAAQYIQSRLAEVTRQRNASRTTIRDQTQSITELERQAAKGSAKLAEARSQIARQTAAIAMLSAEREAAAAVAEGQAVQVQELVRLRAVAASASKIDAANQRIIRSQEERLAALGRDVENLGMRSASKNDEIARLGQRLDTAQDERAQLAIAVPRLESTVAELSRRAATAEGALLVKVQDLAKARSETDQIRSSLGATEAQRAAATEVERSTRARLNETTAALAGARGQHAARSSELAGKAAEISRVGALLSAARSDRQALNASLEATRKELNDATAELEKLGAGLEARVQQAAKQQSEIADLQSSLRATTVARDRLRGELSTSRETGALQRAGAAEAARRNEIDMARSNELRSELTRNRVLIASEQQKVAGLTLQAKAVQGEVMRLLSVLRVSHENSARLKKAAATAGALGTGGVIAANLEELYRFRSEFFGRLSGMLGDRENIRQVGDRFVFQAEVLFGSGSAQLGDSGRAQLAKVASMLKEIALETPANLNWILRVDGHTDRNPIQTSEFPSNWELSAARAISVVKFFIDRGVSADRLSANGFGEYQPLDDSESRVAHSRNRRIELKLTER